MTSTGHSRADALADAPEDSFIGEALRELVTRHRTQLAHREAYREAVDRRNEVVRLLLDAGVAAWKITEMTKTPETPNGLHFTTIGKISRGSGPAQLAVAKDQG